MKYDLFIVFFLALLSPLFISLFTIHLFVYDAGFYHDAFLKYGVYERVPFDADSALLDIISFLRGGELTSSVFSETEFLHLLDVRNLFFYGEIIFYAISILFLFWIGFLFFRRHYALIFYLFFYGGLFSILLFSLFTLLPFSSIFLNFHLASFSNDYWILPSDSSLVLLFPQEFFFDFYRIILLYSFIWSFLFLVIAFLIYRLRLRTLL